MRALFCLLLLGSFGVMPARAETINEVALPEPFKERLTERVPVSGRSLVGVLSTATATLPEGKGLVSRVLRLPGAVGGAICVRARTEDGLYEAENTFMPTAMPGGIHALTWSAEHADRLGTVPLREVAALTTVGECGSNGAVIPTEMGDQPSTDGHYLQVLVNTRGAATWAVLRDPAAGGPALARARCTRLEEGARVAYDARCVLAAPARPAELRLEQEGRDGLSLEVVARTALAVGGVLP